MGIVTWLSSGAQSERLVVPGENILDIDVEAETSVIESKRSFGDPAILSYGREGKPAGSVDHGGQLNGVPSSKAEAIVHTQITTEALHKPNNVSLQPVIPTIVKLQHLHQSGPVKAQDSVPPSATLTAPFNEMSLNGDGHGQMSPLEDQQGPSISNTGMVNENAVPLVQAANNPKKRQRKSRQSQGMVSTQTQTIPDPEPDPSRAPTSSQKRRSNRQKGWRQTPLLTEPNMANNHLPRSQQTSNKSNLQTPRTRFTPETLSQSQGRRHRYREEDDQNGWATGEATDIQDMGDFDFEENLSKFDKRKVFEQIRQEDTTADEARLVSHNRLGGAEPGTAGGKNLHYTENVLESPARRAVEHSSDSEHEIGASRMSRTSTRTSTRKAPSRKGSALTSGEHHGSASTFVNESASRARRKSTHSQATSQKVSVRTDSSTTRLRKSSTGPPKPKPSLRLVSADRTCPCVSPLQMLELEQLATSELGLTEEMMTENAARCVAETAYGLVALSREGEEQRSSKPPLIVLLAGNHKTGSRAIAAARHLLDHGARVVLCVLGPLEREDEILECVRRQLKIFHNCGGNPIKQDALMRVLRQMQAPTDLIVDALFGMHVTFEDLRTHDQASYFQLMCWANGSEADTLSVDIPSGIDASSGLAAEHDDQSLRMHASRVLSLGAPKTGLLTALATIPDVTSDLYVADIGIGPAAWRKFGNRRRHGVEFRGEWVAELRYHDGSMA